MALTQHNIEALPTEERDMALGRYMDAFSRLEGMINQMTRHILGIDPYAAQAIASSMMTRQSIELLKAAATLNFNERGVRKFTEICEQLLRRNIRRNSIVHGTWINVVTVENGDMVQEWVRWYRPIDPALAELRYDDPKNLGLYSFTIPVLEKTTDHVLEMVQALSDLYRELPDIKVQQQSPLAENPQ